MTEAERQFARAYALTGDLATSSQILGGDSLAGAAALEKAPVRQQVERTWRALHADPDGLVQAGLMRLAFGQYGNVLPLLLEDTPTAETWAQADVFGVSSIKRDKAGGIEIRFCDRLEALQALYTAYGQGERQATGQAFLDALGGTGKET